MLPGDLEQIGFTPTWEFPYREQILDEAREVYPGDLLRQAMYSDQHTFLCSLLDRNDRMTMGASIECRVPFLDHRVVERLASLSSAKLLSMFRSKQVLRTSLGGRLPRMVQRHRKWGFTVPWVEYFRREPALRSFIAELPEREPVCSGPFDRAKVRAIVGAFLGGEGTTDALVSQLAMITLWHQGCLDGASAGA